MGWEASLDKGIATHSNILAWRIPRTERSLAGYSPWGQNKSDLTKHAHTQVYFKLTLRNEKIVVKAFVLTHGKSCNP